MKNVVKSSKQFFGYFNTLETHSDNSALRNFQTFQQPCSEFEGGEDDLQKESAENAKSTIQCENRHMLTLMPYSSTFSFEPSTVFISHFRSILFSLLVSQVGTMTFWLAYKEYIEKVQGEPFIFLFLPKMDLLDSQASTY